MTSLCISVALLGCWNGEIETMTVSNGRDDMTGDQRLPMRRDEVIALANEAARNPYASAHMNAAVARLIAALIENQPPAFDYQFHPVMGAHGEARKYLENIMRLVDDVIENVASEAELQGSYDNITSNALHDSDLPGDLTEAGEKLVEDAMEDA